MSEKQSQTVVPCPRCGAPVAWTMENQYRPFCSERCRKIDLGAWAAGEYRVPAVEQPEPTGAQPDQDA